MVGPGRGETVVIIQANVLSTLQYCIICTFTNLAMCASQQSPMAIVQSQMAILASVWETPASGQSEPHASRVNTTHVVLC